jgi:hypothetical protein
MPTLPHIPQRPSLSTRLTVKSLTDGRIGGTPDEGKGFWRLFPIRDKGFILNKIRPLVLSR